ncbi:DUF3846 domain-containing protein [Muribaculaceae bacterium Isolate-037 (Harlan)]|nr:DUF3846 domain-containing protein [Muribaculaceae bacterium Isolate-037 (Harlan)]
MATLITPDGTLKVVHPKAGIGKKFTLKEMQSIVEGYVEYVRLQNGGIAVVNEDGKLIGLQCNPRASLTTGYQLVGNVLLCDVSELRLD